jgi:hypothetical protein
VRRLARALVERREIPARRCRQILFRALRKDLRRARIVAERDRRNQQAWDAEFRRTLGLVARYYQVVRRARPVGCGRPVRAPVANLVARCGRRRFHAVNQLAKNNQVG